MISFRTGFARVGACLALALAACSEMTCIGPVPRLDQETWAGISREFQERRDWEARGESGGAR